MLPFMYQMKAMNKVVGKGIQRPYINKRNRLMLSKGKKPKGGFFHFAYWRNLGLLIYYKKN